MHPSHFNYGALKAYSPPSKDTLLSKIAKMRGFKYYGSSSTITGVLTQLHFLISQWRPINLEMFSKGFDCNKESTFTQFQRSPTAIILKPKGNVYAIDRLENASDSPSILTLVGQSLEKLFTVPKEVFETYRKGSEIAPDPKEESQGAYHYTGYGNILVRSQLDAHDSRLPGSGIFDVKTRAVLPIRMDSIGAAVETMKSYEIKTSLGQYESFEREVHDMARATLLKYSLQARLGRMDGIFVAFHNITRLFGFQYLSIADMDLMLHGRNGRHLGDQELKVSLRIMEDAMNHAAKRFPNKVCLFDSFLGYKF